MLLPDVDGDGLVYTLKTYTVPTWNQDWNVTDEMG